MKRIFILAALVCFGIAIAVAAGIHIVTVWNVWICAGLAAAVIDKIIQEKVLNA